MKIYDHLAPVKEWVAVSLHPAQYIIILANRKVTHDQRVRCLANFLTDKKATNKNSAVHEASRTRMCCNFCLS